MCARWDSKTSCLRGSTGDSQKLNKVWALFLRRKKIAEGVCNVAKLATLCISIYPNTGWAMGQTENTRCVNRGLIKLVPLKLICVNALSLTALIYIYTMLSVNEYTPFEK